VCKPLALKRLFDKAVQLLVVVRYLVTRPVASMHNFSFYRLKRGISKLLTSSPEDFEVWVSSRFPGSDELREKIEFSSRLDQALDTQELAFPACESPLVSIVVPVYNNYRMTMQCLGSILDNCAGIDYELVVADDASTDLTRSIQERVHNIRVIRSGENRGFVLNCNDAAACARGRYLVILNNDTAVSAGWLVPMLDVLDNRPDVGIVGPKLLFADGKLQEAGGIVWRDGSGWNFGRCDDPRKPQYNYLKEVDYVSGACLAIRRELWLQLGGFDSRYVPAYYEDTDLCFAAREAGYKVMFQPQSIVCHFEGGTHGADLDKGLKQFQSRNRDRFVEKWRGVLEREHFPNGEHEFLARDRSRRRNCILVIDHFVPHYDRDAGSRSTLMYMKLMLDLGYKVVFLGADFYPHQPYTGVLESLGIEVLVGEEFARNFKGWLRQNASYISVVYVHRPLVAEHFLPYIHRMRPRPKIIFFGHDLNYLRVEREENLLAKAGAVTGVKQWKSREFAIFHQVDVIYYPSSYEVSRVLGEDPALPVRAIPLYVFDDAVIPEYVSRSARELLFVGGFNHPPNIDGLCWFVKTVLPLLQRNYPDVHLHVVGSDPPEAVLGLQSEAVTIHGYVSDPALARLYRQVGCAVVPLRYGAGVKGKVLEAIRHGVPLVTTTTGAEGLEDAQEVMFIADDPEQFAGCVARVFDRGDSVDTRLARYGDWLQGRFGRARAEAIVLEDFGPVERVM